MRKFVDLEAELGSDDEDHDEGKAKSINSSDRDENEDGLDEDLKGFVVTGGQDEEIGEADDEMRQKFIRDREADDKANVAKIWSSVILGNNRKRKRGEIEFEELDEASKKKLKRIEQRMEQEWDDENDD